MNIIDSVRFFICLLSLYCQHNNFDLYLFCLQARFHIFVTFTTCRRVLKSCLIKKYTIAGFSIRGGRRPNLLLEISFGPVENCNHWLFFYCLTKAEPPRTAELGFWPAELKHNENPAPFHHGKHLYQIIL